MKQSNAAVYRPSLLQRIHENRAGRTSQSKRYTRSKAGNAVYVVVLLILPAMFMIFDKVIIKTTKGFKQEQLESTPSAS